MAKSKFDYSLLKPVEENNKEFESQLTPLEEKEEDYGQYIDTLPKPEGFLSKLPRNILIGLTHAGRNLHNLPHNIAKVIEGATEKFTTLGLPNALNQKISSYLPYDERDFSTAFGGNEDENTFMDTLIQKGLEYSPELIGVGGLIKAGMRKYPITQRGASRQLREAEKLVNKRNINNFQLNNDLLQETIQFLPKTNATAQMIKGILEGEYAPSFALQSQVGKHARDLAKSPLASERLLAPQARELKQRILHEMEQSLRATGHHEEAKLLTSGINDYRKYIKFREKVLPVLKKIGIPTTGLAVLGVGLGKGKKMISKIID